MNFSHNTHTLIAILAIALTLCACHKRVGPTQLQIVDPNRHYYPVVQGEELRMSYLIINRGRHPFVIQDVQPADMNINLAREAPHVLPPHDSLFLAFVYRTERNVGFSEQKIRIFGNVSHVNDTIETPDGVATIKFDVHIVRPTLGQVDYEEIYYARRPKVEEWVDGTRGEQGYYTDEMIQEREAAMLEDGVVFYNKHHSDDKYEFMDNYGLKK